MLREYRKIINILFCVNLLSVWFFQLHAQDTSDIKGSIIYQFELHEMIAPPAVRIVNTAIDNAEEAGADFILMDLDTYGGLVDAADEIRSRILGTDITTLVFIRNNAASAGALISIACDSIYMAGGSTIGAATVVDQTGQPVPEKYQSYMRQKMRATAEETGRDPEIAEGMVDDRVEIEGITEEGKIITFSVTEAIEHGYCNAKADSPEDVIALLNLDKVEVIKHTLSTVDKIIGLLTKPAVSSILLLIIIGGIYFELQTPGVGFPIAASAIAAILYFSPLYLEGLAEHWEILLFIVGIGFLILEIFIIPGFGVAGLTGIVLIMSGLTLSMLNNIVFDFTWVPGAEIGRALLIVLGSLSAAVIGIFILGGNLMNSAAFKKAMLSTEESTKDGYVIDVRSNQSVVGKKGIATTDLRPSGKIEIENEIYDAQSDGEYIDRGTEVLVESAHGAYLKVNKTRTNA
ncbi:MAG: nodulation protein NfeD [Bacteroidia bacterium]|nr:nodulation protein NfeD [Bacteroidia bacterium]